MHPKRSAVVQRCQISIWMPPDVSAEGVQVQLPAASRETGRDERAVFVERGAALPDGQPLSVGLSIPAALAAAPAQTRPRAATRQPADLLFTLFGMAVVCSPILIVAGIALLVAKMARRAERQRYATAWGGRGLAHPRRSYVYTTESDSTDSSWSDSSSWSSSGGGGESSVG